MRTETQGKRLGPQSSVDSAGAAEHQGRIRKNGTGSVRQSRSAVQPPVSCDGGRRSAPLKTQEHRQGLFGKFTSVVSGLGVKLGGGGRRRRACYTFITCTGRRGTQRLRLPRALGTRVCCSRVASCCPRLARRWRTDCDAGTSPRHRARLAHVSSSQTGCS